MRKPLHIIFFLSLLAVTAACSDGGERHRGSLSLEETTDSLYSKEVLAIYGSDPQRALAIIDSGELAGNISEGRATLLRATVYCNSPDEWPLDTVSQMLERLLQSDFIDKDPGNREDVLNLLVNVSRRRSDNVAYLRWATEKANFCRQQGKETEALRTEVEIGVVLSRMGEVEKGLSKINGVIGTLDNQRHFNEMDACIIALKRKINVLFDVEQPDEVIPIAKRMVEKINDYRKHPDLYDDGSHRIPPSEEKRQSYCDFYTSQAYSYLTIAYGELSSQQATQAGGSPLPATRYPLPASYLDSSRYYLALFERSDYSKTLNGKMILSSAYLHLGQYAKVLPLYDEIEARMGGDTLNSDYAVFLKGHAIMAEAAGNYYVANNYRKRYGELKDILNKQLLESRAHEYAVRYHLQEEEMKVESEKRKVESGKRMIIGLSLFALAAVGFIARLLFLRHSINRKNKVLAEQLAEAAKIKGLVDNLQVDKLIKSDNDNVSGVPSARPTTYQPINVSTNENLSPQEMSDKELFEHIADVVRKEHLFTDPNFGRQTLMDRFKLSDRRIGAAFSKGSPYASIIEFTRELRLEYACQLLTERPDMSIKNISDACGFGSPIVFNRAFKAKHEITPTYYREQVSEN